MYVGLTVYRKYPKGFSEWKPKAASEARPSDQTETTEKSKIVAKSRRLQTKTKGMEHKHLYFLILSQVLLKKSFSLSWINFIFEAVVTDNILGAWPGPNTTPPACHGLRHRSLHRAPPTSASFLFYISGYKAFIIAYYRIHWTEEGVKMENQKKPLHSIF